jgi:predicted DCC family thiol-disulfide oxidoreductase YuxK
MQSRASGLLSAWTQDSVSASLPKIQPVGICRVSSDPHTPALQLVYDGGCPFCRHFASTSELRGGVPRLTIIDGRADAELRHALQQQGFNLASGAVLIEGERIWHGADAVAKLCSQLEPSDGLLKLLQMIFGNPDRTRLLYPVLLLARRLALAAKGLPVDPG